MDDVVQKAQPNNNRKENTGSVKPLNWACVCVCECAVLVRILHRLGRGRRRNKYGKRITHVQNIKKKKMIHLL